MAYGEFYSNEPPKAKSILAMRIAIDGLMPFAVQDHTWQSGKLYETMTGEAILHVDLALRTRASDDTISPIIEFSIPDQSPPMTFNSAEDVDAITRLEKISFFDRRVGLASEHVVGNEAVWLRQSWKLASLDPQVGMNRHQLSHFLHLIESDPERSISTECTIARYFPNDASIDFRTFRGNEAAIEEQRFDDHHANLDAIHLKAPMKAGGKSYDYVRCADGVEQLIVSSPEADAGVFSGKRLEAADNLTEGKVKDFTLALKVAARVLALDVQG